MATRLELEGMEMRSPFRMMGMARDGLICTEGKTCLREACMVGRNSEKVWALPAAEGDKMRYRKEESLSERRRQELQW